MLKWRPFSKLSHLLVFWFLVVGVLSIIGLSAYHFFLCKGVLKQQTLSGLGGPEYLLTTIDLLKTKMLLSILLVTGLASMAVYWIIRGLVGPFGKLATTATLAARTGDLTQRVEIDTPDEVGQLSRAFQDLMGWIKETEGVVSRIGEGDLGQKVELKSDQDTFGKAFQSMMSSLQDSQKTLRESEEKIRGVLIQAPIGLSLIRNGGRYEYVNPKFVELFGYTLEEIPAGRNWFEKAYPDPEYRQKVIASWREELSGSKPGKARPRVFTVTCKDGAVKEILFKQVALAGGTHLVTYEDITERKLAEQALRESEEKYRSLFEGSKDSHFITTRDGKYVDLNGATVSLLGYDSKEELMKVEVAQTYYNPEDRKKFQELMAKQGFVKDLELELKRKDGKKIYALFTVSTRKDPKGNIIGYRGTVQDITERKEAEEALQKSEEEAKRLAQENAIVAEIGQIIGSTLNLNEVFERFVEEVKRLLPFDRLVINLIDVEKNTVKNLYIAGKGLTERKVGETYPLEGSGNAEMVRTKSTLLIQTEDFSEYQHRFPNASPDVSGRVSVDSECPPVLEGAGHRVAPHEIGEGLCLFGQGCKACGENREPDCGRHCQRPTVRRNSPDGQADP